MKASEYDRFGPWAVEISEDDPPPPLFLPYLTRAETPLLSVKIPRDIERRDANPDMHLYDYMVTLYAEDLVILQRVGERVREHIFLYHDIQYLRYDEDLLKGNLHLGLPGNAFDLPFSTVSSELMQRMVAQIRDLYCENVARVALPEKPGRVMEGLSHYFSGLLARGQTHEPQFGLLAAQVNQPVAAHESGTLSRVFYGVAGKTLLESLHLSDGRELTIISRGQDFKYKWQTIYAKAFTYVPLTNIRDVRWEDDARHPAVSWMIIETPAEALSFALMGDNPFRPTYDRFLTAVAGAHKQMTYA